jgi:NAD(P)-dependent dehydrogenase (short-subunit alcohol dehydrogenase family)
MDSQKIENPNALTNQIAVVTGGAGVICSALCRLLAAESVKVAVLDLNAGAAENLAAELRSAGGEAIGLACDVLDKTSLEAAADKVTTTFGRVDILLNGAGGNKPQATTSADTSFFDLPADALRWVLDLNLMGIILPSQVFGKIMTAQKSGVILNFSSRYAGGPGLGAGFAVVLKVLFHKFVELRDRDIPAGLDTNDAAAAWGLGY